MWWLTPPTVAHINDLTESMTYRDEDLKRFLREADEALAEVERRTPAAYAKYTIENIELWYGVIEGELCSRFEEAKAKQ